MNRSIGEKAIMNIVSALILITMHVPYACEPTFNISNNSIGGFAVFDKSTLIQSQYLFKKYTLYNNFHGWNTFIRIKNNEIYTTSGMLDSCKLDYLNSLLLMESLAIKTSKDLDDAIGELFSLDELNILINSSKDSSIPTLDSTFSSKLEMEFTKFNISFHDYLSYYNKTDKNCTGKVYAVLSKKQKHIGFLIKPEINLIFIYSKLENKSFQIEIISPIQAKGIIEKRN